MREAVIVSTARTGLAKSHRGGFNNTGGVAMAGHAVRHSIERAGIDPAEVDGGRDGLRHAAGHDGQQHRPAHRHQGGLSGDDDRCDGEPPLFVGAQRDRDGRRPHHRRWRADRRGGGRRVDHAQPRRQGLHAPGRQAARGRVPGTLDADDRDRRHRGSALQDQPRVPGRVLARESAPHGRRTEERALRRRDRADEDDDAGPEQGDWRLPPRSTTRSTATSATGRAPRSRAWRRSSRCAARTSSSPPATPRSSRTARLQSC